MKIRLFLLLPIIFLWTCNSNVEKEYYQTGELKAKYRIENEKLHGTYYEYYKSGVIKEEAIYINGKLNGIRRVYYENGKLDFEAHYNNGNKDGLYKEYSETGKLIGEVYFKNDLQDSITRWYYSDGTLEKYLQFKDGVQHGTAKFYYEDGQIKLDAIIEYGKTVYYKEYSEDGKLEEEYRDVKINTVSDTVCVGDTCAYHFDLLGPQIDSLPAKIDISADFPAFKDFYFQDNVFTFDTVFLDTGKYRLRVYCKYEDGKGYVFTDSLWVVDCGNASNELAE